LQYYSRLMDYAVHITKYLLGISLAIMTAVTVMEVVRRYLFGLSFPWAEELVRFMLIWVTFVGGAAAFRSGGLVMLDLVTGRLPERAKLILQLFTNTVVLVFLLFLFRNGISYSLSPVIVNQNSAGLGISMTLPYMAIPLGFGLMILFSLEHYHRIISQLRKE
jgi:C4-dicarboxylate transporter DctQ subunit